MLGHRHGQEAETMQSTNGRGSENRWRPWCRSMSLPWSRLTMVPSAPVQVLASARRSGA